MISIVISYAVTMKDKENETLLKKNIGKLLKLYREKASYSQEELATLVKVSTKSISKIETGNAFMSAGLLSRLCEVLNLEEKDLFDFQKLAQEKDTSAKREEIVKILSKLNAEKVDFCYEMMCKLKNL